MTAIDTTPAAQTPRRPRRDREAFGLACWRCGRDIEIPAEGPHRCPHCKAELTIAWGEIPMTSFEALHWLDQHAAYILVQQLAPMRRQKNRCLLEFRLPDGQRSAVGGRNLYDAVRRAAARTQTFQTRNDLPIPGPETRCIQSPGQSEGVTTNA